MKIIVCCATIRGYRFLKLLFHLAPDADIVVFSFQEENHEPAFIDDIRQLTLKHEQRFIEAKQIGSSKLQSFWQREIVDIMLVVSWRYMIPSNIFNLARIGTFVFHDSLLPKYRGFSPTVWAIIHGEKKAGVTLFKIAEDVDSGEIVDQIALAIGQDVYIAEIMEKITNIYLLILERNLFKLINNDFSLFHQNESDANYTCKLLREDMLINWNGTTNSIYNLIRAVSFPYPGAFTYVNGQCIKIWKAERDTDGKKYVGRIPGRLVEIRDGIGIVVLTGDSSLLITEIQIGDGMPLRPDKILNSMKITFS